MFLVLPSNSSMSVFPKNKTSDFKVHLSKSVNLDDSWGCGFAEIRYPRSWYTVAQPSKYWVYYRQGKLKVTALVPIGYYQDPRYVINLLNRRLKTAFTAAADEAMRNPTSGLMTLPRLQMYLHFDPYSEVASLEIEDTQLTDVRVKLSGKLARILGFDTMHYRQLGVYYA